MKMLITLLSVCLLAASPHSRADVRLPKSTFTTVNKENIIHHVGVVKIQQNENLNNNEDEKDDGFDYCDYYYNR